MERSYTQKQEVVKYTKVCDLCNKDIQEYGSNWYQLESYVGEFRDCSTELTIYHFCSYDCLLNFLKKHKEDDCISSQLVKK